MPGNFVSNALPSASDSRRSIDVYQTTLPSFLAASISAGVMVLGSGAWAQIGEANSVVAARAPEPLRMSRREILLLRIVVSSLDRVFYQPSRARQRSGGRWTKI